MAITLVILVIITAFPIINNAEPYDNQVVLRDKTEEIELFIKGSINPFIQLRDMIGIFEGNSYELDRTKLDPFVLHYLHEYD
jgi:hypothetical protein